MNSAINLIDAPVTTSDYRPIRTDNLPMVFFGFRIKSQYDEQRISIKDKYHPQRIMHFSSTGELEPTFYYGIRLSPSAEFDNLLRALNSYHQRLTEYKKKYTQFAHEKGLDQTEIMSIALHYFKKDYCKLLNNYRLTCSECHGYLQDGVYPIDTKHTQLLTNENLPTSPEFLLNKVETPWFINMLNFNLFIFGNCSEAVD